MPAGLTAARPHVLLTADAVGGVWTYALDLADGLLASGIRVSLAVLGSAPTTAQSAAARQVSGLEVTCLDGPLDWLAGSAAELRPVAEALARLADLIQADILHLNSPALAGLASFALPVLGACHSCLATWWRSVEGTALPGPFVWRRDLLQRGYASCDALLAPSQAFTALTHDEYAVMPAVVPNGRRVWRNAVPKQPGRVLTAGRLWDRGKDGATLDRASARLAAPIVALGSLAEPGGKHIAFCSLKTPGTQSPQDVAAWMASAPVFVSASRYEPFGLAVLEAAQSGAALVLSDIPTFRELWDGAAVFVPPGDADGFAASISRLLDDPACAAQAGASAAARATRYTTEAMAAGTLAHYRRIAPAAFTAALEQAA